MSKYFIIAGESSGDFHASHLMKELKRLDNSVSFYGLGGALMAQEGLDSLVDINKMAVMGFWEVLKNLRFLKSVERLVLDHLQKNRPDAVILIPCMIDITQYNKMANDEDKDKMIREQLSESGNFNTVLNVMSAFKYQYDPELYEMCLRYPNMYAPKEIKDNLAKYGLIIKESQGELIDNLKYLCEKEDIPFEIEFNNDMNDDELLELCSKNIDKTIEIYTQDYDEPIKFIT